MKILQIKVSLIVIVTKIMGITSIVLIVTYSNVTQYFDIDDSMEECHYVCNKSGKVCFSISQNMTYN